MHPMPLSQAWIALLMFCCCACASDFGHITLNKEPNDHLASLAQISDSDVSLERTFLSPAHRRAAAQLRVWMEEAGMETWLDAIGNVHGRVNGSDPDAAATVIASHFDTVLDGGKYDGSLGIIVGIAAIKHTVLQAAQQAGVDLADSVQQAGASVPEAARVAAQKTLRAPLHLVAFSDEEGIRFKSTFLGSRALVGSLVPNGMLDAQDRQGQSLRHVLEAEHAAAGKGSRSAEEIAASLVLPPQSVREYVEVHIEQGPVLESLGEALGAVSAIAGQTRLWVVVNGTQGHAGTVPMRGRADALAAGASIVVAIERICGGGPDATHASDETSAGEMLVCTVGELRVWPGASNVIPGSVQLSVDIRAKDLVSAIRASRPLLQQILPGEKQAAACRGLGEQCEWGGDAETIDAEGGLPSSAPACSGQDGRDVPVLVSGAGHDTMAMAEITKVAMMFVRCRGGISHSPLEHAEPEDVAAASAALATFIAGRMLLG
ncbi:allantoate deiminase, chloroplastic-like protein [Dunaliella salina]|uniref:Allantoate deiminase, chloroplastic-like protein n=1 Tax=Dunaliella salina TaxID=3046 RepID=A0ABQ7H9D9_DUNSA|nr:allantoate deiminase, chloroplastic-like protein [Dunaliella salina]|eukprot:KAF5843474.1 allantoate deiminase, chloroplastic-like protein [Dunaliella salina]